MKEYNQSPLKTFETPKRSIASFDIKNDNIDQSVVNSFGEEWKKFNKFTDVEINKSGEKYFDIITPEMVNKNTYGIDVGCGTGRWTKYLSSKIGFMEAVDPSEAIFVADKVLGDADNVRLSMASTDNIPFDDYTFDFAMSIGVLHHIPDTQKAMDDCVKKVKIGGYFYTYLYYSLDNKGFVFKAILSVVTLVRKLVSILPMTLKKIICDIIAIVVYMPLVLIGRFLKLIKLGNIASKLPLYRYTESTFYVIRNDALDRFGTTLEQRFSRQEIENMMKHAGLDEIIISDNLPYWHAVGKRVR
jgi:ubiquinone/menaquinone biosynthesis C-methylase UbiE